MHPYREIRAAVAAMCVLAAEPVSAAHSVRSEGWAGGGFVRADYDESPLAVGRAGVGVQFLGYLSVGIAGQIDRDRFFGLGYAGITLPWFETVVPYARFFAGRRNDVDDPAYGWAGGVRAGTNRVALYIEVHGIVEPGYCNGASIGITF